MANHQLNDMDTLLTNSNLYKLLVDEMVVSNPETFDQYLKEPMEHKIIIEVKQGDKRYYKLNLKESALIKLQSGEYEEIIDEN